MMTPLTAPRRYEIESDGVTIVVALSDSGPATLDALREGGGHSVVRPHPLVEVLTAQERHDRMTLGYSGTTVGARLRVESASARDGCLEVAQRDETTGLRVVTTLTVLGGGLRVTHEAINTGTADVVLFALPTLSVRTAAEPGELRLASGRSEWLGEGRWSEDSVARLLPELGFAKVRQPDRTGYGQSSSGGWSTGSMLPVAVLSTAESGLAWQIESSAGWQWSLSRGDGGIVLSAGGPTEREHQAEVVLHPGEAFTTVAAGLAAGSGRDGAFAALTRLRRALRPQRDIESTLPIVYNDYMNTLMGQPSTEALLPLIEAASRAGAEYFCIDAGWFTDSRDYWGEIGEWRDAPTRFTGGLGRVITAIRDAGMTPGIWLEPEAVGLDSPTSEGLPADAFFHRRGAPVVEQRRKHLDLRHPAARAHLDAVVDRLVNEHGIGFLKLDYNIEPGSGTDADGLAPGIGLLAHTRALRDWLEGLQRRHPHLLLENCASGAMRSDYHLLAVTHLQSTSDQQDAMRYAAIAASAPATVLPEQSGNWAYPASDMSAGELAMTLVSGLSGRLYLAGFLDRLAPEAFSRVVDAVAWAKAHRGSLAEVVPFWPRGLPQWDDALMVLGQRLIDGSAVLFVWSRGAGGLLEFTADADVERAFEGAGDWRIAHDSDAVRVTVPAGPDAAVLRIHGELLAITEND